ncbi:hypothetical protein ACWGH2_29315 [Streptomyces sp. NPDC054871]
MPAPRTAADLHASRTALGLTTHQLADHIDSTANAIHGWETGTAPIPSEVSDAVHRLTAYTNGVIDSLVHQGQRLDLDDVPVPTDSIFRQPLPGAWRSTVRERVASRLGD